jgi:ethanolamine permease
MGYVVALLIHFLGSKHPVGAVLLNMAVFGAVIAYVLQMMSFILLRLKLPHIDRPYVSPFGIPGAALALGIALFAFISLFVSDPIYQKVVVGSALWFTLGLLYFFFVGRHKLVKAPEEEFALKALKGRAHEPNP